MANLNLQGLIDEVLNMVRNRSTASAGSATSLYGGNKDEEAYWSDMRKRNTILEQQKLINEGHVGTENVRSAGELARQRLANEGAANTASSGLEGHKYAADQALKGQEAHANAIITAAGEKSDGKAKSDGRIAYENWAKNAIGATPEEHLDARRKFAVLDQKPPTDVRSFDRTDTATPPPAIPAAPVVSPSPARAAISSTPQEEPERLSAMGKRGFGFLRTNKEVAENLPRERAAIASEAATADKFLSPAEQEKRRKRMEGWL